MYQPALWHDYFAVVGTGAAALTGLVFVAMTLHLDDITRDPVHRHRARTILTGLTAVFIRCALVLMGGQNGQAVAVELIGVLQRADPRRGAKTAGYCVTSATVTSRSQVLRSETTRRATVAISSTLNAALTDDSSRMPAAMMAR